MKDFDNVSIAKVDCTIQRRICTRFGVSGYPSLFFVKDGEYWKYAQSRTVSVFQEFIDAGYDSTPSLGPLPQASFISIVVDYLIECAIEHTYVAAACGVISLIMFVAFLVTCLDYCMGEEFEVDTRVVERSSLSSSSATNSTGKKSKAE